VISCSNQNRLPKSTQIRGPLLSKQECHVFSTLIHLSRLIFLIKQINKRLCSSYSLISDMDPIFGLMVIAPANSMMMWNFIKERMVIGSSQIFLEVLVDISSSLETLMIVMIQKLPIKWQSPDNMKLLDGLKCLKWDWRFTDYSQPPYF